MHPTPRGRAGEYGLCQLKLTTAQMVCPECEVNVGNLHQGMRSNVVQKLQTELNRLGYSAGRVDGVFGLRTHIAVTLFQAAKGLKQDGIVGPRTWKALGINLHPLSEQLQDPYINMKLAARYLVLLRIELNINDPDILAAAYNGGHGSRAVDYMLKVRRANE